MSSMITDKQMRGEILGALRHDGQSRGSLPHVAAADELEWLWAIVDQFHKTADGVVITPRMACYFPIANGSLCFYAYLSPQSEPVGAYPWDTGYSTLEAAEAEKGET